MCRCVFLPNPFISVLSASSMRFRSSLFSSSALSHSPHLLSSLTRARNLPGVLVFREMIRTM